MPPYTNGHGSANGISGDMEQTHLNGVSKPKRKPPLDRKQSTPMMPAFMVSAPGKVIVFGEHAVVHGKVHQN
jgi:mevalonate kinase